MKYFCLFLLSILSYAEDRDRVVVIDSGLDVSKEITPYLCTFGHKDFLNYSFSDPLGHGTHVAHLIARYLDPKKHCLVILKVSDKDTFSVLSVLEALEYSLSLNPKIVNLSIHGDTSVPREQFLLDKLLSKKVVLSIAAGNEGRNLDMKCNVYPACYRLNNKNFHVVASYNKFGMRASYSNYNGPVNVKEDGNDQIAGGHIMSGTSMSTAIHTGKYMRDNF